MFKMEQAIIEIRNGYDAVDAFLRASGAKKIFLVCGSAGALASITISVDRTSGGLSGPFTALMAILPLAALVLTAVSVPLSIRFYQKRCA